jgi:hypothetical protein
MTVNWHLAECRDEDTNLFFPARGHYGPEERQYIESMCGRCAITAQCLDYAVDNRVLGVWGGLSHRKRRVIISANPKYQKKKKLTLDYWL